GLAAVLSVPLWQTALMLAALIFFTAYFMDKRIGTVLFTEIPTFVEEVNDDYEVPTSSSNIDKANNNNLLELQELGIVEPSIITMSGDRQLLVQPIMAQVINKEPKIQNEDISFLQEWNSESEFEEQNKEVAIETNYLSDIETLLAEEIVDEKNSYEDFVTDELVPIADSSFDFLYESNEVVVGQDDSLEEMEKKKKISLQK
ncbi:MAG: hypothetical protein K6T88_19795, partial [Bacillus sp. (in: Bacteria)]|nr:hypothetical protein [Bacillus sp. (in: firmicutes)]